MPIPAATPRCVAFRVHDDGTTTARYSDGSMRTERTNDPTTRLFATPAAPASPPPSAPKPKSLGEQMIALEFTDVPDPGEARSLGDLLSDEADTTTTNLGDLLADPSMEP